MPAAVADQVAKPSDADETRTGRIEHEPHAPTTQMPLFVRAAARPAISVPCPFESDVSALLSAMFQPGRSAPCRSATCASTPVSTIAITTDGLPVPLDHASRKPVCV